MPVYAFVNSRGGVGKTTSSINIATAFAREGNRTVLIDHDPRQGTASRWKREADDIGNENEVPVIKVESGITRVVNDLKQVYDVIVIDGPAYLDNSNTALIASADVVVLPIQPSQTDLWAVKTALGWIEERQIITGGTPLAYFLLNRCHPDERVNTAELEGLKEFGVPILNTRMVNRINYSRTLKEGTTVFSLPANDKARQEIKAIYEELTWAP